MISPSLVFPHFLFEMFHIPIRSNLKTEQLSDSPSTAETLVKREEGRSAYLVSPEELSGENAAGLQHHRPMFRQKVKRGSSLSLMFKLSTSFRLTSDGLWFSLSDPSLLACYKMMVQPRTSLLPHFTITRYPPGFSTIVENEKLAG